MAAKAAVASQRNMARLPLLAEAPGGFRVATAGSRVRAGCASRRARSRGDWPGGRSRSDSSATRPAKASGWSQIVEPEQRAPAPASAGAWARPLSTMVFRGLVWVVLTRTTPATSRPNRRGRVAGEGLDGRLRRCCVADEHDGSAAGQEQMIGFEVGREVGEADRPVLGGARPAEARQVPNDHPKRLDSSPHGVEPDGAVQAPAVGEDQGRRVFRPVASPRRASRRWRPRG